jgi:hypothetical protein
MKDERKLDYLEEERQKIWKRLTKLEEDLEKRTPDFERDAKGAANKAVEHKNRSEEARTIATQTC